VRRLLLRATAVLGLCLAILAGTARADKPVKGDDEEGATCSSYGGTAVKFYKTPTEAATQAKKSEKLVMVLHVSGNFENPDFT